MLQQAQPEDFVIATGEQHSVREFVERAFREVGIRIEWRGRGIEEVGVAYAPSRQSLVSGKVVVCVDPRYFRPAEVDTLLGDPSKAREKLGWQSRISFDELVAEMVREDLKLAERDELCRREGHKNI
jgi:GDPmannose 4,6-dehydratase